MNKKQKLRVVVIFPVIAVMLVFGGMVYGVLQSASATQSPSPTLAEAGAVEGNTGEDGYNPDQAVEYVVSTPSPSCTFDFLIGQTFAQAEEQIKPLNRPYRAVKRGDMMTMEYSEGRINLHVDESGLVVSVTCG